GAWAVQDDSDAYLVSVGVRCGKYPGQANASQETAPHVSPPTAGRAERRLLLVPRYHRAVCQKGRGSLQIVQPEPLRRSQDPGIQLLAWRGYEGPGGAESALSAAKTLPASLAPVAMRRARLVRNSPGATPISRLKARWNEATD